ncbi:MAG TPA: hypothetical protein VL860_04755 [Planctomycetota bacterium]|nr:hypothetical protein [Planctomycetota bacterium]
MGRNRHTPGRSDAGCAVLALLIAICLCGCEPVENGTLSNNDNGLSPAILSPVPRGVNTPVYPVDSHHSWRLESPRPVEGTGTLHVGSALVSFSRVAVELELQGGRARLRCVRPKGATDLEPLAVCTYSGEQLGVLDIDQELSLEGFLQNQARVQFDLGPAGPPATNGAIANPRPRMLIDPLPILRILNHSPRVIQWTGPNSQPVEIKGQDRAEMVLYSSLEDLHKTLIRATDLVEGRLYAANSSRPNAGTPLPAFYVARGKDNQLIVLSDNKTELSLAVGDQTVLVLPAPGARIEIRGVWHLEYTTTGDWVVRPALNTEGAYPVLANFSTQTVLWRNRMSADDIEIPAQNWRLLKPLP